MLHPFYKQNIKKQINFDGSIEYIAQDLTENEKIKPIQISLYYRVGNYTLIHWKKGKTAGQTLYKNYTPIALSGGKLSIYSGSVNTVNQSQTRQQLAGHSFNIPKLGNYGVPVTTGLKLYNSKFGRKFN